MTSFDRSFVVDAIAQTKGRRPSGAGRGVISRKP
jgi:hypothetical protein